MAIMTNVTITSDDEEQLILTPTDKGGVSIKSSIKHPTEHSLRLVAEWDLTSEEWDRILDIVGR